MEQRFLYGNNTIAEFLGGEWVGKRGDTIFDRYEFTPALKVPFLDFEPVQDGDAFISYDLTYCSREELQFHSSWDWFMEAWVKFKKVRLKLGRDVYEHMERIKSTSKIINDGAIGLAWSALVRDLEWYNQVMETDESSIWWISKSESEQNELNHLIFGKPELGETDELTRLDIHKIWNAIVGIQKRNKE